MPSYRLTYFNVRARGETARLLFALKGQEFVDRRVEQADWPALKPESPMGQVPYLEVDSKPLAQSCAIARYLASEFGFMGKTPFEAAQIDSLVELANDLYPGVRVLVLKKVFNQPEKSAQIKEEFDQKFPPTLQNVEKMLKLNNDGAGFLVGSDISVADLHFFSVVDILTDHDEYKDILEPYPSLQQLIQRVKDYPQIKAYLATRVKTPM